MTELPCPCSSGNLYRSCCEPFHQGQLPKTAELLMRSRYAAYALNLPTYIMETTHPACPQYSENHAEWGAQISSFSLNTHFTKLEVLSAQERGDVATVTFVAHLMQHNQNATFTEKSFFERLKGKWFYRGGILAEGHQPTLMTTHEMRLLPIAYYGNPVLRQVAEPVGDITEDLRALVLGMIETMDACNGIGIAAPQVHHSIQLFIIREPIEDVEGRVEWGEVEVYINPVVSEMSEETWKATEGCLSVPLLQSEVERPKEITVEYTDLTGKRIRKRCVNWEARAILHEVDHIHGVLYIDHLPKKEREAIEPFLQRMDLRIHNGIKL